LTESTTERVIHGLNKIPHVESVTRRNVGFKEELDIIVPNDYTQENALYLGTLIGGIEANNANS
jgi:hypothetical protein